MLSTLLFLPLVVAKILADKQTFAFEENPGNATQMVENLANQTIEKETRMTGYKEDLAWQLFNLAAGAYGNRFDDCNKLSFPASEQRYIYSTTSRQCSAHSSCLGFIVNSNVTRQVIFAFRGTVGKIQLLTESLESYSVGTDFHCMGNVNAYFMRAHEMLWDSIKQFLDQPEFRSYSVLLTGHSLGGALAALSAARIVKEGIRESSTVQLYTFGQPRTGSYNFAMNFDKLGIKAYRIVHAADFIPHQPPCLKDESMPKTSEGSRPCLASLLNEAYHHGIEIWYRDPLMLPGARYIECLGEPKNEDITCSHSLTFQSFNWETYAWHHRHYFNVRVSKFGISGCTDRSIEPLERSIAAAFVERLLHLG